MDVTGRTINMNQLLREIATAGVTDMPNGLGRTGNVLHTYDGDGNNTDVPADVVPVVNAHVPATTLRDHVATDVTASIGVTFDSLNQPAQVALIEALLYNAGAIDPVTLAILPINQWVAPQS